HMVRIIVLKSHPLLIEPIQEIVVPGFISYGDQRNTNPVLTAYVDFEQGFLIRHLGWQQVSGTPGGPAVLEDGVSKSRLLLRTFADTSLETLDDAEAFLTGNLRTTAQVIASQVTTREFGRGFLISYSDRDNDGNPLSGIAALLYDEKNILYTADIRLPEAGIDLLTPNDAPPYLQIRQVINTFMILPPEGYVQVPDILEPLPTEAVSDGTPEVSDENSENSELQPAEELTDEPAGEDSSD
ncbi:MAG TPA: hypothetical protein VJZ27_06415, partial [Aggregatilineales bacterium]|nr:hypothetical protein [Aggregatilineales bacterium]